MKRLLHLSGALALGALLLSGCSTLSRKSAPPRPRAFALAVTVHRSLQPTPSQWAAIQAAAAKELASMGCILVSDLALADRIIRVDFTPDPANPEHSGQAIVLGFLANPYRTLSATSPLSSLAYRSPGVSRPWGGYYDRDIYYDPTHTYSWYSDGYTYNAPSGALVPVAPPAVAPPRRHDPRHRDDRPPEAGRRPPSHFAGHARGDHPRPPRESPSYPRHESASSNHSASNADRGSSYSSSSGSSSSYGSSSYSSSSGSSASSSGSSYSPPSHSERSESSYRPQEP